MNEELQKLIEDFNKKLTEAQEAREKVMEYLEDNYDIDTIENWESLEDEQDWCYGIDVDGVERLINENVNEED